jgi:5-methylcytosine-specific restriction protein A
VPFRPPVFGGNSQRDYAQRRGNARAQGYSSRWDRVSRQYRRANPLCVGCAAVGRTTLAQLVDHIVPHKRDYDRMWSVQNLQALCRQCHDTTKQRLEQMHAQSLISDEDLRMDSPKAVELTKRCKPK